MPKFANHWIVRNLLPPILARAMTRAERRRAEVARFAEMYRGFVASGDLCFDVGANLGNRVRCMRALGCRVVAIEPQARCLAKLARAHGGDSGVIIEPVAVGSQEGSAVMRTSAVHVLSTLSDAFISSTRGSGRFDGVRWDGREEVRVTTLDALIERHGMPRFVKIDVEGYEGEVLGGLSRAVAGVSFEWTPEMPDNAHRCVARLLEIGDYEFNYSWGESMRLARTEWLDAAGMRRVVDEFAGERQLFGDIYARLKETGGPGA